LAETDSSAKKPKKKQVTPSEITPKMERYQPEKIDLDLNTGTTPYEQEAEEELITTISEEEFNKIINEMDPKSKKILPFLYAACAIWCAMAGLLFFTFAKKIVNLII
ncbi:MAG: hypothetical protein U9O87_08570, partial [Verrucomicrobiota bacterium]|nr:hypothetical protein [Verrucomicrobiota bacterium]